VFHWLADSTIDELFDKYAVDDAITFAAFKRLVRYLHATHACAQRLL
jgi:hypothetical protein